MFSAIVPSNISTLLRQVAHVPTRLSPPLVERRAIDADAALGDRPDADERARASVDFPPPDGTDDADGITCRKLERDAAQNDRSVPAARRRPFEMDALPRIGKRQALLHGAGTAASSRSRRA